MRIATITVILSSTVFMGASTIAAAQSAATYPNRSVRILSPFPPGGSTTPVIRIFVDKLSKDTGQAFVVDNRPGGNTSIASTALVRSTPDAYTLLMVTNGHVLNPLLVPDLPYNPVKDFAGISTLISNNQMLYVHPSVPANNLQELVALLKRNGDKMNMAVTNAGSLNHLIALLLMQATGTKFTPVHYKGSGQAMQDLLSGTVQMGINTPTQTAPLIKAGKLKGIVIAGTRRNPAVPDVPTFTESGLPGFSAGNWYALLAPSATPKDLIDKINGLVRNAQSAPDVVAALTKLGVDPFPNSPAGTEAHIKAELALYGKVIKDNDIRATPED